MLRGLFSVCAPRPGYVTPMKSGQNCPSTAASASTATASRRARPRRRHRRRRPPLPFPRSALGSRDPGPKRRLPSSSRPWLRAARPGALVAQPGSAAAIRRRVRSTVWARVRSWRTLVHSGVVPDEVLQMHQRALEPQAGAGVQDVRAADPPLPDQACAEALVAARHGILGGRERARERRPGQRIGDDISHWAPGATARNGS